jgi:hypothetical protein
MKKHEHQLDSDNDRAARLGRVECISFSERVDSRIPLTLALSHRERENRRQPAGETKAVAIRFRRPLLFPLLAERARVRGIHFGASARRGPPAALAKNEMLPTSSVTGFPRCVPVSCQLPSAHPGLCRAKRLKNQIPPKHSTAYQKPGGLTPEPPRPPGNRRRST